MEQENINLPQGYNKRPFLYKGQLYVESQMRRAYAHDNFRASDLELLKFYDVETYHDLIDAMEAQIEKLQAITYPLSPIRYYVTNPREG